MQEHPKHHFVMALKQWQNGLRLSASVSGKRLEQSGNSCQPEKNLGFFCCLPSSAFNL